MMDVNESYFGTPDRVKLYKNLSLLGFILLSIGIPLIFFKDIWTIIGVSLSFIGLMCVVSGILGLQEEKKKTGMKIKSTSFGVMALIFGIGSVFVSNRPYLALILGAIAIILAIKAVKEKDNLYGLAGGICGVIGIVVNIYVWALLEFVS